MVIILKLLKKFCFLWTVVESLATVILGIFVRVRSLEFSAYIIMSYASGTVFFLLPTYMPLFLYIFLLHHIHSFLNLSLSWHKCLTLWYCLRDHWGSVYLFYPFPSCLFKVDHFYWWSFKFIDLSVLMSPSSEFFISITVFLSSEISA